MLVLQTGEVGPIAQALAGIDIALWDLDARSSGLQWVLSLPIPLPLPLAAQPLLVTPVLQVVHRAITRFLLQQAGLKAEQADSGAVTLIQPKLGLGSAGARPVRLPQRRTSARSPSKVAPWLGVPSSASCANSNAGSNSSAA